MTLKSASPTAITPYDYLKIIAILLMVIDHVGAYFYPEIDTMRALGRLCVPIWLFLIGYAQSRRIDSLLVLSAVLLTLLDILVGGEVRSLNILWTIIAIRVFLNPLMHWIDLSKAKLLVVSALLFVLSPLVQTVVNYGTLALILSIWGYLTRHNGQAKEHSSWITPPLYGAAALICFFYAQIAYFQFPPRLFLTILVPGGVMVFYALTFYLPRGKAGWEPATPFTRHVISFVGHHTLLIYVGHMLVIYAILFFSLPLFSSGIDPIPFLH